MDIKNKKVSTGGKVAPKRNQSVSKPTNQLQANNRSNKDLGAILSQTRFKQIGQTAASKRSVDIGAKTVQINSAKDSTSNGKVLTKETSVPNKPTKKPAPKIAAASSPKTSFKSANEPSADMIKPSKTLTVDVDDGDSDIEVEEVNIISKTNLVAQEGGNAVIAGIMKQVEELEKTLKANINTKEDELKQERNKVEQLKNKNDILEQRDKARKETLDKIEKETGAKIEEKNNQIETLQNFSKKNNDLMAKRFKQKQDDIGILQDNLKKVGKELKSLEKWKEVNAGLIDKEKANLKKVVQSSTEKEAHYKQTIKALEAKIGEKEEKITSIDKNVESLQKKMSDKDTIAREMKHKVASLVAEFTKAIKERDDKLEHKNKEIQENLVKIEKLLEDKAKLEEAVVAKDAELKSRSLQNAKQVKLLKDKSKKLEIATSQSNNREKLYSITKHQLEDKNSKLQSENKHKNALIKKLQNKLVDIKTMKANNIAIGDEDLFEDKLEKVLYESYKKKNEPLMLTYIVPVLNVDVDPYFLQKQTKEKEEKKQIKAFHIETKPLMINYLWPLQPFQGKVATEAVVVNRGVKRIKSQECFQSKRMKADRNNPEQVEVSFKRKFELGNESVNKKRKVYEEANFIPSICDDIINQVADNNETPGQELTKIVSSVEKTSNIERDNVALISSPEKNLVTSVLRIRNGASFQFKASSDIKSTKPTEIIAPLMNELVEYAISFIEVKNMLR